MGQGVWIPTRGQYVYALKFCPSRTLTPCDPADSRNPVLRSSAVGTPHVDGPRVPE